MNMIRTSGLVCCLLALTIAEPFSLKESLFSPEQFLSQELSRRQADVNTSCPNSAWESCGDRVVPLISHFYARVFLGEVLDVNETLLDTFCRSGEDAIQCMNDTAARCTETNASEDAVVAIGFVCSGAGREAALAVDGTQCQYTGAVGPYQEITSDYETCVEGHMSFFRMFMTEETEDYGCLPFHASHSCLDQVFSTLCSPALGTFVAAFQAASSPLVLGGHCSV